MNTELLFWVLTTALQGMCTVYFVIYGMKYWREKRRFISIVTFFAAVILGRGAVQTGRGLQPVDIFDRLVAVIFVVIMLFTLFKAASRSLR